MRSNLKELLETVLDGRKKTPWGKNLGMSPGVITKFFNKGILPSDAHLKKIMKSENVSLNALWGASVTPFIVHRTNSPKDSYEILSAHLSDSNWSIYLITGDEFPIIVFSCPSQELIGNEEFNYTHVEIICGPMDHACANLFAKEAVKHVDLPKEEAHELASGYKGTYYLFGKQTLNNAEPISQSELIEIFRDRTTFNAAVLNRVLEIIDETILQEKASITSEERRKLVTELYAFALEEGLNPSQVSENLAHSMLRVI